MAKFKLKRKTFNVAAVGKSVWNGAKTLGTGAGKLALGIGGAGLVGAGVLVNKAGAGDLLSGGEKSAKKMEFS